MKKTIYSFLLCVPLFTLWFCTSSSAGKEKRAIVNEHSSSVQNTGKNVAVLELFTSQGCSSCPPADKLLGTYISKENVIVLSFHVDYWDRLGWKDPFSAHEYSERQYKYASALNSSVYTPQLVVNGQSEMVGSDGEKISSTVDKVQAEQPDANLSIKNVKPGNDKVNINFTVSGKTEKSILNIAIVEKKTETQIKAGENGGVTLANYNVVRTFKTLPHFNDGENSIDVDIPAGIDSKNISVVLLLQKNDNKIIAADQALL